MTSVNPVLSHVFRIHFSRASSNTSQGHRTGNTAIKLAQSLSGSSGSTGEEGRRTCNSASVTRPGIPEESGTWPHLVRCLGVSCFRVVRDSALRERQAKARRGCAGIGLSLESVEAAGMV